MCFFLQTIIQIIKNVVYGMFWLVDYTAKIDIVLTPTSPLIFQNNCIDFLAFKMKGHSTVVQALPVWHGFWPARLFVPRTLHG